MCFKIVRLTAIRNGSKRTISASGEFELLRMVSESDNGRYVSEEVGSPRGVDCEILHQLERGTNHCLQMCENLSLGDTF